MKSVFRAGNAGFFIVLFLILSGCSDSTTNNGDEAIPVETASNTTTGNAITTVNSGLIPSDTTGSITSDVTTSDPADLNSNPDQNSDDNLPAINDSTEGSELSENGESPDDNGDTGGVDTPGAEPTVANSSATGSDLSGGEDDSPTTTESLSLAGPFIKDTTRGAGPPSVPQGLTLLISAENWLEFTWVPSIDDQSVEAYEIYRDGTRLYTVRGDTGYEFDYRSWISTSYTDCNYTRYPGCKDTQPTAGSSHAYTVVAVDNEGMSSAHSDPVVFQLESHQDAPVDLSAYSVVFDEDFTASELNRDLWKTALPWGANTTINGEMQYFVDIFGNDPPMYDPFTLSGSTLKITGKATPADQSSSANGMPYLSGAITTSDHFEMTYGYVEMSARFASGTGLLSTFYLFNQDFEKNKPEIDIVEYIGSRPDKAYQTYHYFDSNRARYASGEKHSSTTMETNTGIDLSADFHTYGVLWEKGLIVWYIDGAEVRRLSGVRVSDEPMNIIAHLVIGSEWIGQPDPSSIPATLEIDYIRAWQKP